MRAAAPHTPPRAPTNGAAGACCQRYISGTQNVRMCTSPIACARSSNASRQRWSSASGRSNGAAAGRRAPASASHARRSTTHAVHSASNAAASRVTSNASSAAVKRQRRSIAVTPVNLRRGASAATRTVATSAEKPLRKTRGNSWGKWRSALRFHSFGLNLARAPTHANVLEVPTSPRGAGTSPVAMISPSASSPALSGINPWFFRICPSDLSHGPDLARFARRHFNAARAAVIYVNNDYGRGVRKSFSAEFARLGGQVVEEDPYVPGTPSLEPYLSRIRQQGGVDVLMLASERPGAELALREMAALGVHWPTMGGDALTGIEVIGPLAEGLHISSAHLPDRPG